MYSTYTIYTRKEYMKFARVILTLRSKKNFLFLYIFLSIFEFFILGNWSFFGVLIALIYGFLLLLVALILSLPVEILMFRRNWNTDKMMHNLRLDMTFNENDLKVNNLNGQSVINYDNIYEIIETKTRFYIMVSVNKGYIVVKDNCSKELIDRIRKIKK